MPGNHAILLTPPGPGAIAVVRLVGPAVGGFLGAHFSKTPAAGRAVHGDVADAGRVVDDAVVVLSADGAFADLNAHGGPWVVESVRELARRYGFDVIDSPRPPLPPQALDDDTPVERE